MKPGRLSSFLSAASSRRDGARASVFAGERSAPMQNAVAFANNDVIAQLRFWLSALS